ncbi:MAG: hypothetical protein J6L64_01495 [Opitutales bacterium]|nr:hypothetical protein [Opitutales bacterium]
MLFSVGRELHLPVSEMLEMPLANLYQFAHLAMLYAGCSTQWTNRTPQEEHRFCENIKRWKALQNNVPAR